MTGRPISRLNPSTTAHPRRTLFTGGAPRRPATSSTTTASTTLLETPTDNEDSDILVRNSDGNYAVMIPELQRNEGEITAHEAEDEAAARLEELLKDRRPSTEAELLETLNSNLRRKVVTLEEDKWMFKPDDGKS